MKIGFDAKRAFVNSSGLGNYSRNTLNALIKYYPENKYLLVAPEIRNNLFGNHNQFEKLTPQKTASKIYQSVWRTFFVSPKLKEKGIDIFHGLSNELPHGINKSGVVSVVTIHDLIFLRYPEYYSRIDRNIYFRKVKNACLRANKIIAISQQTKNDIVHFLKINPEKITIIYQSVAPVYFEKNLNIDLKSKYSLPEKFILSVGTIEPRKNQLSVLKALYAKKIDVPVIFVGKPTTYVKQLKKVIAENKFKNQIIFLNNLPEKDLAGLYQMATLSVYISVFEGFGLPVIESMASACPVITSTVSCLPETAGDAAVLCNPENIKELGDKIYTLLNDNNVRNKLVKKGELRAKLFHPENYSEKLISLYSEIL